MKRAAIGLAAICAVGFASAGLAQDMKATAKFTETAVIIELEGGYTNVMLSITGPNEFHTTQFSEKEGPAIDLRKVGEYDDGPYTYRVTGADKQIVPIRTPLNDGREDLAKERRVGVSISGSFVVEGGKIVEFKDIPEERAK